MDEHHISYAQDLERCCRLLKGLLYIIELITSYEDETPYLTALVTNLVSGLPAEIHTKCSHGQDGVCHIDANVASLNDMLDQIEHTVSLLELEVSYEGGGFYTDSIPDYHSW